MSKGVKVYAAIGVVIILFGFLIATTPCERGAVQTTNIGWLASTNSPKYT